MTDRTTSLRDSLVALSLAWVGGFVDGVSFLTFYGMFVTFMSGNTTIMGVHLPELFATHSWFAPLPIAAFPIVTYVIGGIGAGLIWEIAASWPSSRVMGIVLTAESLLLVLFAFVGQTFLVEGKISEQSVMVFFGIAVFPTLAMGMQNVTARKFKSVRDGLTFVTGTLTGFAESFSEGLVAAIRQPSSNPRCSPAFR
ncbi:hypothetical protein Pan216_36810 [Planctomycetes bacterium Pan216]|uniref:DUF1275 domain-containing protein n=1 Tax=Kolteria novifilia TaxID=2527975 RepID=A0A518B758_9BACT|nr:hypothetical protein Pan216_36810 [Planctomycetes bacterium Pan216]